MTLAAYRWLRTRAPWEGQPFIDQSPGTHRFACLAGQNGTKIGPCGKVIYWTNPDDWITGLSYRALLICDSKFVENRPRESLH
jgi:hypothetical protein